MADTPDQDPVRDAYLGLLNAYTVDQALAAIIANPALLHPAVTVSIAGAAAVFAIFYGDEVPAIVSHRLTLLALCREVGPAGIRREDWSSQGNGFIMPMDLAGLIHTADKAWVAIGSATSVPDVDPILKSWHSLVSHPALALAPAILQAGCWNHLGACYDARYRFSNEVADLDAAVNCLRIASGASPPEWPERSLYLTNLGWDLVKYWSESRDPARLDDAVAVLDEAEQVLNSTGDTAERCLIALGTALTERYDLKHDLQDLDRTIAVTKKSIAILTIEGKRNTLLAILAGKLDRRFDVLSNRSDLDEGLSAIDEAYKGAPSDQALSVIRATHAQLLYHRYHCLGFQADLQQSITLAESATSSGDRRIRHSALMCLAEGLHSRYLRTGDRADIDRAVSILESKAGDDTDAAVLINLGGALYDRYQYSSGLEDLDAAMERLNRGLGIAAEGSRTWRAGVAWLAAALRFRRKPGDLNRSIELLQEVVDQIPSGSLEWGVALFNLAASLDDRAEVALDGTDQDRALVALEAALPAFPEGAPSSGPVLNNFASQLVDAGNRHQSVDELRRGIQALESLIPMVEAESPFAAQCQCNCGSGYQALWSLTHSEQDALRAAALYETALGLDEANPSMQLRVAKQWTRWAAQRGAWTEAAKAARLGLAAAQRLYERQVWRGHREHSLMEAGGMASLAAYVCARANLPREAALALETGRVVMLSEALDRRGADLGRLRELGHDGLVGDYLRAIDRLAVLERRELVAATALDLIDAVEVRTARDAIKAAIAQIRQVDGHADFLAPAEFAEILQAATGTAIAYIAVSEFGSLAIVVEEQGADVHLQLLPELTQSEIGQVVGRYLDATHQSDNVLLWSLTLDDTTRWLWRAVMDPLLKTLPNARRLALIPAGQLGLLPLHAAWTDAPERPSGRRYALDVAVITYAPSARALNQAKTSAGTASITGVLAVSDPQPSTLPRLTTSTAEADAAVAAFGQSTSVHLTGASATRTAVLERIAAYPVLHLACHGRGDPMEPLSSCLVLAGNERLTLQDLFGRDLTGARLAILSACDSGVTKSDIPDEAIGFPTGLLQAGVPGVISALWPVPDRSTTTLMCRLYHLWRSVGQEPPEALRNAQQWVRDSDNKTKQEALLTSSTSLSLGVRPRNQVQWEGMRAHAAPIYWASFTYCGW